MCTPFHSGDCHPGRRQGAWRGVYQGIMRVVVTNDEPTGRAVRAGRVSRGRGPAPAGRDRLVPRGLRPAPLRGDRRRGRAGATSAPAPDRRREHVENITQIMWPSDLVEGLGESVAYRARPRGRPGDPRRGHGLRLRHAHRQGPGDRHPHALAPGLRLLAGPAGPAGGLVLDRPRRGHRRQRLHVVRARVPPRAAPAPPPRRSRGRPSSATRRRRGRSRSRSPRARAPSTPGPRCTTAAATRPPAIAAPSSSTPDPGPWSSTSGARGFDHGKSGPGRENRNAGTR